MEWFLTIFEGKTEVLTVADVQRAKASPCNGCDCPPSGDRL